MFTMLLVFLAFRGHVARVYREDAGLRSDVVGVFHSFFARQTRVEERHLTPARRHASLRQAGRCRLNMP